MIEGVNASHLSGEVINERDRCGTCAGRKVTPQTKLLEVHVDKGMKDEQRITFHGEGDQMPGVEPGDVIIVLQVSTYKVKLASLITMQYCIRGLYQPL